MMIIKCIAKEPVQCKNTGKWFIPGEEYEIGDKRAKELLDTKLFEKVKKDVEKTVKK